MDNYQVFLNSELQLETDCTLCAELKFIELQWINSGTAKLFENGRLVSARGWRFEIWINDELIQEFDSRKPAKEKFDQCKDLEYSIVELREIWNGDKHNIPKRAYITHRHGNPPCPISGDCRWRKSLGREFHSTTRPTAFRVEVIAPSDRCGWALKPSRVGGEIFDYAACIQSREAR